MNPIVIALIADYFETTEVTAHGLLTHLRINGWTVVPIPVEKATFLEPEEETT
jgi:hypothetical protein